MISKLKKQFDFLDLLKNKLYVNENYNKEFNERNFQLLDYGILYNKNYKINITKSNYYIKELDYYLSLIYKCVDDVYTDILFMINNDIFIRFYSMVRLFRINKGYNFYDIGILYNNGKETRLLCYSIEYKKFFYRNKYNHSDEVDEDKCFSIYELIDGHLNKIKFIST